METFNCSLSGACAFATLSPLQIAIYNHGHKYIRILGIVGVVSKLNFFTIFCGE